MFFLKKTLFLSKLFFRNSQISTMNNYPNTIYTIGHSNHTIDYFLELLQTHHINCIVDVRSTPASSYSPQFNQLPLRNFLKLNNIIYMHFGKEFGARQEEKKVLDKNGKVDFEAFRQTNPFQKGVKRIQKGLNKNFKIALMCSEGNPMECHRFSMIAVYLEQNVGLEIQHILKDKSMISNQLLEQELLKKYKKKLPQPSLFEPNVTPQQQLKAAYQLHNQDIGWTSKQDDAETYDF